jgi:hypothetical protein
MSAFRLKPELARVHEIGLIPLEAHLGQAKRLRLMILALGAEPDSIRMFRHPARHALKYGSQLTLFQCHVILQNNGWVGSANARMRLGVY